MDRNRPPSVRRAVPQNRWTGENHREQRSEHAVNERPGSSRG
jgi:hypothetical protein